MNRPRALSSAHIKGVIGVVAGRASSTGTRWIHRAQTTCPSLLRQCENPLPRISQIIGIMRSTVRSELDPARIIAQAICHEEAGNAVGQRI